MASLYNLRPPVLLLIGAQIGTHGSCVVLLSLSRRLLYILVYTTAVLGVHFLRLERTASFAVSRRLVMDESYHLHHPGAWKTIKPL